MVDSSFMHFVRDQLGGVPGVTFRRMFGGYGLYFEGAFFGLISDDRLFFKTTEATRALYIERGMAAFNYETKKGVKSLKNYYEVPIGVIEDDEELGDWARIAIELAHSAG